jgi:class 3 adenylate cyclase
VRVRRLRPLDKALLTVFLPLWVVCFGLHAKEWARGRLAWIPLTVASAAAPDEPPSVSGFLPGAAAESPEFRVGDRLLRVGAAPLQGAGPFAFAAAVWSQARPDHSVEVEIQRGDERRETRLQLLPVGMGWRLPLMSIGFAVPAFLVLVRRPGSRTVRLFFAASLAYSLNWTFFFGGPPAQTQLWLAVWFGSALLMFPLALQAILSVPAERSPTTRGALWTWALSVYAVTALAWVFGVPFSSAAGVRASGALNALAPLLMLALLVRNYRRSDPLGRRQLRWVLYGFLVGVLPVAVGSLVPVTAPRFWWLHEILMSAVVLLPACMLIAIVRFKLFDVDRLLTATVSYSLLLVLLVALLIGIVPRLAELLSDASGVDPATSQTLLSLLLAIGVVPGGRIARDRLERTFLAERRALGQGIERLLGELAAPAEPEKVLRLLGERLDSLLRPDACVIYGIVGSAYAPVFQRGGCAPPVLFGEGRLAALLETRRAPLDVEDWRLRERESEVDAAEWAALDSLRAAVLIPIFAERRLLAILVLGEKLSGDIYTGTDLSLLTAVGHAASRALERYGEAEVHRRTLEMQQAMRRYVPGAIAEEIEVGRPLTEGRREVSVLFVDIRGYTAFAESREARDIFAMINRYTGTVSREIRAHGGSIVEFNGDGMMAVFGAPHALPAKERAAVEASVAVAKAVRALDLEGLDVGLGIATGEAFVGNIRAVDRAIWAAIGNTTNLAARLEGLTRSYDASIVIDESTWSAAEDAAAHFVPHDGVRVRGRRDAMTLYMLPHPDREVAASPANG